ncbi:MAG: alpha/beta hydrolase [Pseudomonadota bacterium]
MDAPVDPATLDVPRAGETPADCLARIDALAERRRVSFGDGEMVWRIWGEGRPLVLLHGGYGAWSHWVRNVLPLAAHRRVVVADLPSHGDSDRAPGRPTRDDIADMMARSLGGILRANEKYDLVGFSMGANLSAAAVAAYGRMPENLVVVGTGGLGIPSQRISGLLRWRPDMPRAELDERHRNNLGIIMIHDRSRIDDLAVHIQRENGLRMRYRMKRTGATTSLRDFLPQVDTRLSCIWGEYDVYAAGNREERIGVMRRTHPDLRVSIIDDAAHWVMYERPSAFNESLLRLLD